MVHSTVAVAKMATVPNNPITMSTGRTTTVVMGKTNRTDTKVTKMANDICRDSLKALIVTFLV